MTSIAYEWGLKRPGRGGHKHRVAHMTGHRGHRGGPRGFDFAREGFGGHRRGRRPRGDVRAAILLLLAEESRNGYQLMQEIEERSGGAWRPSPGSMYPALAQLEDEGLVVATAVGTGREFALTDAGRAHVDENREALGEPWTEATRGFPKEGFELRGLIKQVAIAAAQVMAAGTQAQREEAVKLLAETRRGLYRLLAQEDEQE